MHYYPITYRLYPTTEQETLFNKTVGCCRFIYNRALSYKIKRFTEDGITVSNLKLSKALPKQKLRFEWLKEVDATALQQALRDLESAYSNFFRRVKSGEKVGFPKFKCKNGSRASFRVSMGNKLDPYTKQIKIGKLGYIKAKGSFNLYSNEKVVNITTYRESNGHWYCSVLTEREGEGTVDNKFKYEACGIDASVKIPFAIASNEIEPKKWGVKFSSDLRLKEAKLKRYQRAYSRKQKGSNNQKKAKQKLGKAHYAVKMFRKDYLEKLTTKIASTFSLVSVEALKLNSMSKSSKGTLDNPGTNVKAKSGLNRELLRLGLGYFLLRLQQKCLKFNSLFVRVNPRNTSNTCSSCKHVASESRESQSRFVCIKCGFTINADFNAGYNILDLGLA